MHRTRILSILLQVTTVLFIVGVIGIGISIGWDFFNLDLELPKNTPTESGSPATSADLHAVTYNQLLPHFERLVTWTPDWKPDSNTRFGKSGWICHDERDLYGLDVLAYRALISSRHEGQRKPLSEYYEGEENFPKGLFEKQELKKDILPYFEKERQAMLVDREARSQ